MTAMSVAAHPRLILASASPRRRELLARTGLDFEIQPSGANEDLEGDPLPEDAARELALRKARSLAPEYKGQSRLLLGSDTIVALGEQGGGRLLGKPASEEEARRFLGLLSGTTHRVVTGVAVLRTEDGAERVAHETTRVTMRELTEAERDAYVATGEWRDKAGGYAIQESADAFVTQLEGGGFDNVVGLPVELALALIEELGGAAR